MSAQVPAQRPKFTLAECQAHLKKLGADMSAPIIVMGFRGNYSNMGNKGKNDRKIYDDAIVVVLKDRVVTFNGNCDPNGWRKGHGTGSKKGMATLKAGLYKAHSLDLHNGKYLALCQRKGKVTVLRDADETVPANAIIEINGERFYQEVGMFGINIHKGGYSTTSSLGCQTIPPAQWNEFIALVQKEMKAGKVNVVQYALVQLS